MSVAYIGPPEEESLRDLVARLIDSAKAYLNAEVALIKTTASVRIAQAKPAAIFAVTAILLVQAALTVLVAALGMLLARWLTPAGGLAAGAVLALLVAGLLGWMAARQLSGGAK